MHRYPGKFVWFELFTPDVAKSKAFWSELMGWTATDAPMHDGSSYSMLGTSEQPVLGLMDLSQLPPGAPPHFFGYLSTDDVDASAARCEAAGGAVHKAGFDVPGVGRIAVVADAEGAMFGLFQGEEGDSEDTPSVHGTFHWVELWTSDPAKATGFYREVFDYGQLSVPMPEGGEYHVLKMGEVPRAGVLTPHTPLPFPHWVPFLHVDDVDALVSGIEARGGGVVTAPVFSEGIGRWGVVRDNVGAEIGVITPAVQG